LIPVANLPLVSINLGKDVNTGGRFSACVNDAGGQPATGVVDKDGAPGPSNISANFENKSKRRYLYSQGLRRI
jgi:hypothetical protein